MSYYTRKQLETWSKGRLDEYVDDLKGEEAAKINDAGQEAQIAYILSNDEGALTINQSAGVVGAGATMVGAQINVL